MRGDYLLDKFQLTNPEPDIYRLGQYRPVSVRDQIVRASYLVERLWVLKRLAPNSRLVVIGAGAAGVTAAVKAVHFGVARVVVADARDRVLSLQANCTTRWLDPAQYDWPLSHWDKQKWPIDEPPGFPHPTAARMPPLTTLEAEYADEWAARFEFALSRYERVGSVSFEPNIKAVGWSLDAAKSCYVVKFNDVLTRLPKMSLDADVVIFAGGFGSEHMSVPLLQSQAGTFSSSAFWADDRFEAPSFGLASVKNGVLVSGGGDGALQDYIRLASGQRSARVVWKAVESVLSPATLRALERLGDWDRSTQDAEQFAPNFGSACDRLAALHTRYLYEVQRLTGNVAEWANVVAALDTLIYPPRPLNAVYLALKADHFDACYPLNRLVSLLIIEYIKVKHKAAVPLETNVAVQGVVSHSAAGVVVQFALKTSCSTTNQEISSWTDVGVKTYDAVVIRHGIDTATLSIKTAGLAPQPVPPHLP